MMSAATEKTAPGTSVISEATMPETGHKEEGGGGAGAKLSAEEEEATSKFLENVNKWRAARSMEQVIQNSSVSCVLLLSCRVCCQCHHDQEILKVFFDAFIVVALYSVNINR